MRHFAGLSVASSDKILDRARIMHEALGKQIDLLTEEVRDLKSVLDCASTE